MNDKEVYIPKHHTFHMMPIRLEGLYGVTLTIDGTVKASKRQTHWSTTINKDGEV